MISEESLPCIVLPWMENGNFCDVMKNNVIGHEELPKYLEQWVFYVSHYIMIGYAADDSL